jgi:protein-S-isoprenylcysteine O-methyltransferase Ste14
MSFVSLVLFVIITAAWLLEFVLFRPRTQAYTFQEPLGRDWVAVVIVGSTVSTLLLRNQSSLLITGVVGDVLELVGLALYATGTIMRYAGSIALGPMYNRFIQVETNQPLVSNGIYKFIRHPMYVGLFLLIVAFPMYFKNGVLIGLTLVAMFFVIHHRMNFEERIMEEVIGERYVKWKREHHRFFPHIVFGKKTSR